MGTTSNYGWEYPDNGGDVDTWGAIHTTMIQAVDVTVKANADAVSTNYLAKAGGAMTGELRLSYTPTSLNSDSAGFRGAPGNSQAGDYTFVMADAGKSVIHSNGSAHAWTIPPNSSVAYPVGTVILLCAPSGTGAITITRGAGVALRLGGNATDANRTLAANGLASILKVGTDSWYVQGSGLS